MIVLILQNLNLRNKWNQSLYLLYIKLLRRNLFLLDKIFIQVIWNFFWFLYVVKIYWVLFKTVESRNISVVLRIKIGVYQLFYVLSVLKILYFVAVNIYNLGLTKIIRWLKKLNSF